MPHAPPGASACGEARAPAPGRAGWAGGSLAGGGGARRNGAGPLPEAPPQST